MSLADIPDLQALDLSLATVEALTHGTLVLLGRQKSQRNQVRVAELRLGWCELLVRYSICWHFSLNRFSQLEKPLVVSDLKIGSRGRIRRCLPPYFAALKQLTPE
jgi:hypothetical protein